MGQNAKSKLNALDLSIVVKKRACAHALHQMLDKADLQAHCFLYVWVPMAEGPADGLGRPHQPCGQRSTQTCQ